MRSTPSDHDDPCRSSTPARSSSLYCLGVPLVLALATGVLLMHKGPYWLSSNLDPDYPYLFNALAVMTGREPAHIDHPGTPAQLLFALMLRIIHAGRSPDAIVAEVLIQPEYHLILIQCALLLLLCVTLYVAARVVLQATGSMAAAVASQLSPLLSTTLLQESLTVRPEPLLMVTTTILGALAIRQASLPAARGRASCVLPAVLGAVAGTAVALKLNALPLLAVPLVAVRGRWTKALALCAAGVTATLWLLPIWGSLPYVASFATRIATQPGRYGHGGPAANPAGNLVALALLLAGEPLFAGALLGAILALAVGHLGRNAETGRPTVARTLLAMATAAVAQIAIVLRHPYESRYLLPALALAGPMLAVTLLLLRPLAATRLRRFRQAGLLIAAVAAGAAMILSFVRVDGTLRQRSRLIGGIAETARRSEPGAPVFCFYRASTPEFALSFGNDWSRHYFARQLATLHPRFIYYNLWASSFASFRHGLPLEYALTSHRILLQGIASADLGQSAARPEFRDPVLAGPIEALYRVQLPRELELPFGDFVTDDLSAPEYVAVGGETVLARTMVRPTMHLLHHGRETPMFLDGVAHNPGTTSARLAIEAPDGSGRQVTLPPGQTQAFRVALPAQAGAGSISLTDERPAQEEQTSGGRLLFLSLRIVSTLRAAGPVSERPKSGRIGSNRVE